MNDIKRHKKYTTSHFLCTMTINPDQIRAARALLKWSQNDLSERSGVSVPAIANIEVEKQQPNKATREKIARAFEEAGIEIIDGGIRRRREHIRIFEGERGFADFMLVVHETAAKTGRKICVANVDENDWLKVLGPDLLTEVIERNNALGKIEARILVEENDWNFIASKYAEYRWIPKEFMGETPFYIFGDNVALIQFAENNFDVRVYVLEQPLFAKSFLKMFDALWSKVSLKPKKSNK